MFNISGSFSDYLFLLNYYIFKGYSVRAKGMVDEGEVAEVGVFDGAGVEVG